LLGTVLSGARAGGIGASPDDPVERAALVAVPVEAAEEVRAVPMTEGDRDIPQRAAL
jgi:hypothetical protein